MPEKKESFWERLFHPLLNERGEVGEGDADADADGEGDPDGESDGDGGEDDREVLLEGIQFPGEDDDEDGDDDTGEGDDKAGKADKGKPTVEDRIKDLETKHKNASDHIQELKVALHQARQENKTLKSGQKEKGGEDFSLTDEQVVKILEEHGNDYDTVVKVINYQAAKAAHKARASAVDDVETKQMKGNLEAFLAREWPDVLQEDSKIAPDIETTIDKFRLAENPFNRYLASAAMLMANWPTILAAKEKEIRKSVLEGKAEDARKKIVRGAKLADKGSERAVGKLAPNIAARARQMGLSPRASKIYAKLVSGDSKKMAATVEAE